MFRHSRPHRAAISGGIPDSISICSRPTEIEDRALPGHWEGDLISGANQSAIATIVDKSTRFTVLCRIEDNRAETVTRALVEQMHQLPAQLRKSLTWDRGWSCRHTVTLVLLSIWSFTSAIQGAPGSGAPTKIRTDCYASPSQKEQAWQAIRSASLTRLPPS